MKVINIKRFLFLCAVTGLSLHASQRSHTRGSQVKTAALKKAGRNQPTPKILDTVRTSLEESTKNAAKTITDATIKKNDLQRDVSLGLKSKIEADKEIAVLDKTIIDTKQKLLTLAQEASKIADEEDKKQGYLSQFIAGAQNLGAKAKSLFKGGYGHSEQEKALAQAIIDDLEMRKKREKDPKIIQELDNEIYQQQLITGAVMSGTQKALLLGAIGTAAVVAGVSYFGVPSDQSEMAALTEQPTILSVTQPVPEPLPTVVTQPAITLPVILPVQEQSAVSTSVIEPSEYKIEPKEEEKLSIWERVFGKKEPQQEILQPEIKEEPSPVVVPVETPSVPTVLEPASLALPTIVEQPSAPTPPAPVTQPAPVSQVPSVPSAAGQAPLSLAQPEVLKEEYRTKGDVLTEANIDLVKEAAEAEEPSALQRGLGLTALGLGAVGISLGAKKVSEKGLKGAAITTGQAVQEQIKPLYETALGYGSEAVKGMHEDIESVRELAGGLYAGAGQMASEGYAGVGQIYSGAKQGVSKVMGRAHKFIKKERSLEQVQASAISNLSKAQEEWKKRENEQESVPKTIARYNVDQAKLSAGLATIDVQCNQTKIHLEEMQQKVNAWHSFEPSLSVDGIRSQINSFVQRVATLSDTENLHEQVSNVNSLVLMIGKREKKDIPLLQSEVANTEKTISDIKARLVSGNISPELMKAQNELANIKNTLQETEEGRDRLIGQLNNLIANLSNEVKSMPKEMNKIVQEVTTLTQTFNALMPIDIGLLVAKQLKDELEVWKHLQPALNEILQSLNAVVASKSVSMDLMTTVLLTQADTAYAYAGKNVDLVGANNIKEKIDAVTTSIQGLLNANLSQDISAQLNNLNGVINTAQEALDFAQPMIGTIQKAQGKVQELVELINDKGKLSGVMARLQQNVQQAIFNFGSQKSADNPGEKDLVEATMILAQIELNLAQILSYANEIDTIAQQVVPEFNLDEIKNQFRKTANLVEKQSLEAEKAMLIASGQFELAAALQDVVKKSEVFDIAQKSMDSIRTEEKAIKSAVDGLESLKDNVGFATQQLTLIQTTGALIKELGGAADIQNRFEEQLNTFKQGLGGGADASSVKAELDDVEIALGNVRQLVDEFKQVKTEIETVINNLKNAIQVLLDEQNENKFNDDRVAIEACVQTLLNLVQNGQALVEKIEIKSYEKVNEAMLKANNAAAAARKEAERKRLAAEEEAAKQQRLIEEAAAAFAAQQAAQAAASATAPVAGVSQQPEEAPVQPPTVPAGQPPSSGVDTEEEKTD